MIYYTPYEYMLIGLANAYGLDKRTFEERIEWAKINVTDLLYMYNLVIHAKNPILFQKAIMALEDVHQGIPTGYIMDLDCTASGIQILACLTGCKESARLVNFIDPDIRYDAYTESVGIMNQYLEPEQHVGLIGKTTRDDVKQSLMTVFYGSSTEPVKLLGKGTPQLRSFYKMVTETFKGPWELTQELINAWQPYAAYHEWNLPDGHTAHVKVMQTKDVVIELDELDHATFTHRVMVNEGTESGVSLVANVTHSIDAMLVREVTRRCNFDRLELVTALTELERITPYDTLEVDNWDNFISLAHVYNHTYEELNSNDRLRLMILIQDVLEYHPFEVAMIHDSFWCSPLHMNRMRYHICNIFAELADSDLLSQIFNDIYGTQGTYEKLSNDLGDLIRSSNYFVS
jgi:hypothetical protein